MCSCCDPTHDSPDPVVVRLEREVDRLNFDLCQCRSELTTAREIAHRLGTEREELRSEVDRLTTAWKAIDRANESLRERLAAALDNNERQKRLLETQRDSYDAALVKNEALGEHVTSLTSRLAAAEARYETLAKSMSCYRCADMRQRLAAAESLLTTACDAWECGQMVWNQEGVLLSDYKAAMLPRAWYEAAKGGRDETETG